NSRSRYKSFVAFFNFMIYTVYVLYSATAGKHYTGYTSDLPKRLLSHNQFGKDWTSRHRPWKLIYTKDFATRQEALAYEGWLKTGVGRDFIKSIAH
ncbi:MAG TPA: GIY-YIG nuclease family protein, partial [Agriterribacter sp.]|nr:GIY-YIG nuclease family protein [Agriterribacter sp.]